MDRSKGVVGTSSSTIAHFADAQKFLAANIPSVLIEEKVFAMRDKYNIPAFWFICVGILENAFKCGFRLALLPLLKKLYKRMGIALGQLDWNSFPYINSF